MGTIGRILKILGKSDFYRELVRTVVYYFYEHVLPMERVTIGSNPEIHPTVSFRFEDNIKLGNDIVLDAHVCVWASPNSRIIIGDNIGVGPGTIMVSSNHRFLPGQVYTKQPLAEKDIVIGNDVWIGANCTILGGAKIGKGSVIGAGCVIYRSIPEDSVVVSGGRKLSIVKRR